MTARSSHSRATGPRYGPRIQLFGVEGRRELRTRLASVQLAGETSGVRFTRRRAWTAPARGLRGRAGLWHWREGEEELSAKATSLLLEFVHPLVASGTPYCVAWPFAAEVFARRPLAPGDTAGLDLEDIGALLAGPCAPSGPSSRLAAGRALPATLAARAVPTAASSPAAAAGTARREHAEGGERLDAAQRAAVDHARGPARVLAPAGSGKTKTLVSRVVELVARGADPGGILLLAFNRKAAEQLEERLADAGIATTRRLRDRRGRRPAAVHCATFNAFGSRYEREVAGAHARLTDARGQRALMLRAM